MSSDSDCMYHCNYPGCSYETNRSAHLKRHERTHTKERPYKCQFCNYCASRSDHLRRHYKIHGKILNSPTSRAHPKPVPVPVSVAVAAPVISVNRAFSQSNTAYSPFVPKQIDQGSTNCNLKELCVAAIFLQFIHKVRRDFYHVLC